MLSGVFRCIPASWPRAPAWMRYRGYLGGEHATGRLPLSRNRGGMRCGAASAALEPGEAVEDEVERVRELGGAIACSQGAAVGDRQGHLHDVGVGSAELALELGCCLR